MKFILKAAEGISAAAVEEVLKERGHLLGAEEEEGLWLFAEAGETPGYSIEKKGKEIRICYQRKVHFFRALGELLLNLSREQWRKEYTGEGHKGVQYDCSRNAVLHKGKLKELIRLQAMLGLDQLYLYTEDTYQVEGQPYFGALRGRYRKEELQECDRYAKQFGVELIPSIQVLAHLRTVLRWPAMSGYKDNEDILLVEEEATYQLLEDMLRSLRELYTTDTINLGMDEAFFLGFGNYRLKHGIVSQESLMKKHLERVSRLCKKYQFHPMMWSDMFFRNAGGGNYYQVPEDYEWKEEERPDKDTTLIYWDYYEAGDSGLYRKMAHLHKKLTHHVCFACGGWIWNGLAPNYDQARASLTVAFEGLKGTGLTDSFLTLWQDNGAETPVAAGIPMMAFYSACAYEEKPEPETMEQWYRMLTGESYEDMLLLGALDSIPGTAPGNREYSNPTKALLYQDPLVGIFDRQYGHCGLEEYYGQLSGKLWEAAERSPGEKQLFCYYSKLAEVAAVKCNLGCEIREAYLSHNRERLQEIRKQLPELALLVGELKSLRHWLWEEEAKENGWEILDIRFSGVMARLSTAAERIDRFLKGEIPELEELEEERLLYLPEEGKVPSCNLWEAIVSAANIVGV